MEQLALYLLKSTVCITAFLGVYWCFLKNETFYRFNRFFLLTGLLTAVLLPFYTYTFKVSILPAAAIAAPSTQNSIVETATGFPLIYLFLMVAYALGVVFLGIRYLIGLHKMKSLIHQSGFVDMKGYKLVRTSDLKSSFSVFNYIILNGTAESSEIEKKLILEHELAHVKQLHWLDLLIAQLICVFQWFNPLIWVYRYCIKQNHEFLADTAVLEQGNPVGLYRAALLNHSLGTPVFALSSSFAHYDKLKRVKMMTKSASAAAKKLLVLVLLPLLAGFLWAFAKPDYVADMPVSRPELQVENVADTAKKMQQQKPEIVKTKWKEAKPKQRKPKVAVPIASPLPSAVADSAVAIQPRPIVLKPAVLVYLDGQEIHYDINLIKSERIEAIQVLKDAAAVAAYGERGKNGVILITSKKVL